MSAYQQREYSRFDPDAPDLRLGAEVWPRPACVHCGRAIEYSGECDACAKEGD